MIGLNFLIRIAQFAFYFTLFAVMVMFVYTLFLAVIRMGVDHFSEETGSMLHWFYAKLPKPRWFKRKKNEN